MKRAGYFILFLILISPALFPSNSALNDENNSEIISSGQYEGGYRYNMQGWVYIHVEGEPYERGYQYGYLASAEIIEMIQRWSQFGHNVKLMKLFVIKNLPKNYDKLSEQWWNICRLKAMNTFIKQVPEEYKQEMEGMADGIKARGGIVFGRDIEYEDIVASQFVQDIQYTISKKPFKGFHPVRGLLSGLRDIFSGAILNPNGHCNAFIATGDATSNGGIVVSHATIFPNYIAERCNFIVDVKPSEGYRFMMTCPPGSLWSQEDWYQNDQGIVITETELYLQGPWKTRRTIPKGVRSRKAIQYSDSIDEVIQNLKKGNNGVIPNEWLIGDKKTGEIASYQQALYNTPIKRTFNGYYWSCNLPHDVKVLAELSGVPQILLKVYSKLFTKKGCFSIDGETIVWNAERAQKLTELGEQYYGKIDTEIAKKIMATPPLTKLITDCKITGSKLMENMGLIAFMGKIDGKTWIPTDEDKNKYHGVTELPPSGWVELYASKSESDSLPLINNLDNKDECSKILWQFETTGLGNMNYSSSVVSEDVVYTATSSGEVYALDTSRGTQIWSKNFGEMIVEPVMSEEFVFIGTDLGLHSINKGNGKIKWEQLIGRISSKPVVNKNLVIVGCSNGDTYAFDVDTGEIQWSYSFSDSTYISELCDNNVLYVGSGKTCYAFNIADRELVWEYETAGVITASPKIDDDTVYFGSWDGKLYALDAKTGDYKWDYKTGWGIDSTPDVSDGMVFVGSLDNNFYALDVEKGEPEWFFTCKAAIHSSPVAYGDYVFFGCDDGRFYALDKTAGNLAWYFAPSYFITEENVNNYITTPILSNPVVEDGVVYFGAKGTVYALDAQTFEKPKEPSEKPSEIDIGILLVIVILIIIVLIVLILIYPRNKKKDRAHK